MTKIIVANWKMNGSKEFIAEYFRNFIHNKQNQVIFCPPALYIQDFLKNNVLLGAQDCSEHVSGAYTGEISAEMVKNSGCQFVIVGHSERRQHHHETNEVVKKKAEQALKTGLTPIICVGESKNHRESGAAIDFVIQQLQQSLPESGSYYIAYEPVWAIGTGLTATTDDIIKMHQAIYDTLKDKMTPILYGGSVNKVNAHTILSLPKVDGILVGGASLKYEDFNHIVAF